MPDESGEADDVLSMMLGLVCAGCDSYNDPGSVSCVLCGHPLTEQGPVDAPGDTIANPPAPAAGPAEPIPVAPSSAAASWMQAPQGQPLATAEAMPAVDLNVLNQQSAGGIAAPAGPATNAPPSAPAAATTAAAACPQCGGGIKEDDKFCRHCGKRLEVGSPPAQADAPKIAPTSASVPAGPVPAAGTMVLPSVKVPKVSPSPSPAASSGASATMFFGAASVQRFARLTLVKGHTQFGTQWRLQAGATVIGRSSGMVLFPDDPHIAARHCRVEFRDDDLWIVPEDTRNGVFVRIQQPETLPFGGEFVMGVQRLRLVNPSTFPQADFARAAQDDTRCLGSEAPPDAFAVERIFQDPELSEIYFRPQRVMSIGRARCDVNFPKDPFLSGRHAQLTRSTTGASLEDLGSRNGTFIRLTEERKLNHGDVIMVGEQILRVEVSLSLARS